MDKKKDQENPPTVTEKKNACRKELKHQPHDNKNFQRSASPL